MKAAYRLCAGIIAAALIGSGCTPLGQSARIDTLQPAAVVSAPRAPTPSAAAASAPVPLTVPTDARLARWANNPPLSPGDRVQVLVADGDGFSGRYEVGVDGTVTLPQLTPVAAAGNGTDQVARHIAAALVESGQFRPERVQVSVLVHEWSHVQVHVRGAVFAPGVVSVNARSADERALKQLLTSGDFPSERMLTAALRAAGGVRPDAALTHIELHRAGKIIRIDYTGVMRGERFAAVPLMSGDAVVVPSTGRFDPDLVATSAITPPGIRVFLSNLTVPAAGNAPSAVGRDATRLPYGSRLLTAAISANCVGGIQATNASRHVVLVRNNPLTGREESLERAVDDLLRNPQRNDLNPQVMPNDAVACFDSEVTNIRDIAKLVLGVFAPLLGR